MRGCLRPSALCSVQCHSATALTVGLRSGVRQQPHCPWVTGLKQQAMQVGPHARPRHAHLGSGHKTGQSPGSGEASCLNPSGAITHPGLPFEQEEVLEVPTGPERWRLQGQALCGPG